MAKPKRRISTQYCVMTGRASWHQAKAGHLFSSSICFWNKRDAKKYERNFKKRNPDQPIAVVKERKLRKF